MRALVIAPTMPEFDREGGLRRVFHLIEFLVEEGWSVAFLAHNATGGERYAQALRRMGVVCYAGPDTRPADGDPSDAPEALIAAGGFDLAILAFWHVAERYLPYFREHSPKTRVLIDSIDLHFLRESRRTFLDRGYAGAARALGPEFAGEMARELNAYGAADGVLTVSVKEAEIVNDLLGRRAHAQHVPQAERSVTTAPAPFAERRGVLFVGNFRHPPNAEAVQHLCCEILPRIDPAILVDHPVYIVGNDLSGSVAAHGRGLTAVRMVGWVPSVLPYLGSARVSVIPLLHGAGTKTKLIQAALAGLPSVSTTLGAEGLDLRPGMDALIADDPASFAAATVRLLTESTLWNGIATSGRERVHDVHGWGAVRRRLCAVLERLGLGC